MKQMQLFYMLFLALLIFGCGADYHFEKAKTLEKEGKYTEAIDKYDKIISKFPNSEGSLMSQIAIADIYFYQRDFNLALSYYNDTEVKQGLTTSAGHAQKRIREIESILRQVVDYFNEADKHVDHGEYSKALAIYDKIERLDPTNAELHIKKNAALSKISEQNRAKDFEEKSRNAHDFVTILDKYGGWGWFSRILGANRYDHLKYKDPRIRAEDEFARKRQVDQEQKRIQEAYSNYQDIVENLYQLSFSMQFPNYDFHRKEYPIYYKVNHPKHVCFRENTIIFPPLKVDEAEAERLRKENIEIQGNILFKITAELRWVTKGIMWVPERGIYRPAKEIVITLTQDKRWVETPESAYAEIIDARVHIPSVGIRFMNK